MKPFLNLLIDELKEQLLKDASGCCIVFPTRRAGVIFKKKFAETIDKPAWLPQIYSVSDFIHEISPYEIADSYTLLFELYAEYRKFDELPFEKFFHWGQIILNDFDEIDRNLVNAKLLFSNLQSLAEIEKQFRDEEELEMVKSFWKNFSDKEITDLKALFLKNWKIISMVYDNYKENLIRKNICYEGLAYRLIAGREVQVNWKWKKIIFAGTYAVSKAEEKIITTLVDEKRAEVFTDADSYYSDDEWQEAGRFFRKGKIFRKAYKWKDSFLETGKKEITVAGAALQTGQARYAGQVIKQLADEGINISENTAIVLPDEHLLLPLLHSIPADVQSLNVTMGFPVKQSLTASFVQSLYELNRNFKPGKNGYPFLADSVISILKHPFINEMAAEETQQITQRIIDSRMGRVSNSFLEKNVQNNFLKSVFGNSENNSPLADLIRLLQHISEELKGGSIQLNAIEKETILFLISKFVELEKIIGRYDSLMNNEHQWYLIKQVLNELRIPFTGEPVKGMQVMGFLETRCLDFENLIVLSMNEGSLPRSPSFNSYIPYSLRKGFGLFVREDADAVSAYHFYRLLQRAKRIFLVYDTEVKSLRGGEKSRYLLQIAYELKNRAGDNLRLKHILVSAEAVHYIPAPITIQKDEKIRELLKSYIGNGTNVHVKRLSASALSTYIHCPLRFYFSYIAGIKETEELEDDIDARAFGDVVHKAMQKLYEGKKIVTKEIIDEALKSSADTVDHALKKEFPEWTDTGRNYLMKVVMTELVRKILKQDKLTAPFEIIALEENLEGVLIFEENHFAGLKGIADRIDKVDGAYRIIDYKSGSDKILKSTDLEKIFSKPKQKAEFQLLYYLLLYSMSHAGIPAKAGIYSLSDLSDGIKFMNGGELISVQLLNEFSARLKEILEELFSDDVDFVQTEDAKRCIHCPYNKICHR